MNGYPSVATAVRGQLADLEHDAETLSANNGFTPEKRRELSRIQERIRDLRKQLDLIVP